jgi:hypothetical protein
MDTLTAQQSQHKQQSNSNVGPHSLTSICIWQAGFLQKQAYQLSKKHDAHCIRVGLHVS